MGATARRLLQLLALTGVLALGLGLAACKGGEEAAAASPARATFTVQGMTCGSCEMSIKTKLLGLDGVTEVAAEHAPGRVEAIHDPTAVTPEQMAAKIEALGFTVEGWEIADLP